MTKQEIKEILDIIQVKLDKKQEPLIIGEDIDRLLVSSITELVGEHGIRLNLLIVNSSRTTDYLDLIRWRAFDELPNGKRWHRGHGY